jgi:hypothetical protein
MTKTMKTMGTSKLTAPKRRRCLLSPVPKERETLQTGGSRPLRAVGRAATLRSQRGITEKRLKRTVTGDAINRVPGSLYVMVPLPVLIFSFRLAK